MRSSGTKIAAILATSCLIAVIITALGLSSFFISNASSGQQSAHDDEDEDTTENTTTTSRPIMVEYVNPIKRWPPPMHQKDIIYPEDKIRRQSHHSGHYRARLARIWDPHPEYEFKAFGQNFHLLLEQDRSPFVAPTLKVTHVWQNMTKVEEPALKPNGCFYTGKVKGDANSVVTVNLCHGMTGHIRTSTGSYLIEPVEPWKNNGAPLKHAIRKLAVTQHSFDCFQDQNDYKDMPRFRRKRSLSKEYYLELMVVADKKMEEYHGEGLDNYVLTLMAIVKTIFRDASIGNLITVAVVKFVILKDTLVSRKTWSDKALRNRSEKTSRVSSASEMLRRFCEWQNLHNDDNDNSPRHHDSALLITRENICRDPYHEKCDTLGLAELGTMCDKYSSCSLVRDNGLSAAFTIAHELGHVMNMPHDDDIKCMPYRGNNEKQHNVMSRMLDHNTYPWSWSNCSRHLLTQFLDAGSGDCLLDSPQTDYLQERVDPGKPKLPGEEFDQDKQCELVYGPGYKICPYMPSCKRLWCTSDFGEKEGCRTLHMPWADGTPCAENHWCLKGKCEPKDHRALEPRNGEWGSWNEFGKCSRTCGGGVEKSERECNNPRPSNGGRYCVGQKVRYKSCNRHECPHGSQDFREQQCAKFNNNNFKIQGLSEDVKWVPKYGGISPEDRCKLYCRVAQSSAYYVLEDKVIDGTACGPDNTYDLCIDGVCHPAGCDHELNSTTQLDYCGICGGNNSTCQQKKGRYNESHYGYTTVVRIPAGSSNLDIRQHGYDESSKDDNYIALVDSETREYILNGNYVVSMFQKLILYGGTTIQYSGSDALVERVNSSRPLNKDIIVEVLSVGNLYPPDIVYEYTIQKNRVVYSWELTDSWTACDKMCNGKTWRIIKCVRQDDEDQEVDWDLCDPDTKPKEKSRDCNGHCELRWEIVERSECSSHCGPGERTLVVQCLQIDKRTKIVNHVYDAACGHLTKPGTSEPCTSPCNALGWKYERWGECSQKCGIGVRRRTAICVDESLNKREDSECNDLELKTEEPCDEGPCPKWVTENWTPCSVTCGTGIRIRPIYCRVGNRTDSSLCDAELAPKSIENCTVAVPCPYWKEVDGWSPCSASCGHGISSIKIECSVPGACANQTKPQHTKPCNLGPCSLLHENAAPVNTNNASPFSWRLTWSACSESCGHGKRTRIAHCFDNISDRVVNSSYCPPLQGGVSKIDDCYTRCPRWQTGEWEPCSAICGEGFETRAVQCVSDGREVLPDSSCSRMRRPITERKCEQLCPSHKNGYSEWVVGSWGNCSVACGIGKQTRSIRCINGPCHQPKPVEVIKCDAGPCESGDWKYGSWSQCNVTCGAGYKFLEVTCKSSSGASLPDSSCRGQKPQPINSCYIESCETDRSSNIEEHKWRTTRWAPCNLSSCTKTRKVFCSLGYQQVDDSECSMLAKPKYMRPCKRACPNRNSLTYVWRPSKWNQCSTHCGRGYRRRLVFCFKPGSRGRGKRRERVSDQYCANMPKPNDEEYCEGPCGNHARDEFSWVPDPWQPCTHACSKKGRQERTIRCMNGDNEVPKRNCPKNSKPPNRRKCEQIQCPSCRDLYIVLKEQDPNDQEYILYPKGPHQTGVKVYCHGMTTGRPREYLTVTSRDNFAMVFDQQIMSPNVDDCPASDVCQVKNREMSPGFTVFNKLGLNISSLTIHGDDWTFATKIRGSLVRVGEAGDCFSRDCPQGRFKLSLKGTNFTLSSETQWHERNGASVKIVKSSDQKEIAGRCGGCCGRCRPLNGIKLRLAPP